MGDLYTIDEQHHLVVGLGGGQVIFNTDDLTIDQHSVKALLHEDAKVLVESASFRRANGSQYIGCRAHGQVEDVFHHIAHLMLFDDASRNRRDGPTDAGKEQF